MTRINVIAGRYARCIPALVIAGLAGVSILDEGEGVPAATRDTSFKRYGRRDHEMGNGAEPGLSNVKKIVAGRGGAARDDVSARG